MKTLLLALALMCGGLIYVNDKPELPAKIVRGLASAVRSFHQSVTDGDKTEVAPSFIPAPRIVETPKAPRLGNGEFHPSTLDRLPQPVHGHQSRYSEQPNMVMDQPNKAPLGKGEFRSSSLDRPPQYAGGVGYIYYPTNQYYPPGSMVVQPTTGQGSNAAVK